jgi:hemerythrin
MPQIIWNQTLSVQVQEIDTQHKRLIEFLDQLLNAMSQGSGQAILGEVLDGVIDYTQTHFANEEGLMTAHAYPELPQHKAAHDLLIKQVLELQTQFREGHPVLTPKVAQFLVDWLYKHILEVDHKLGGYLNTKGVH